MGVMRHERGLALIIAVVALLIFAVIAALMVSVVSNDSEMALYQFRSSEATYTANGGMQYAMQFYNARQGTGTISGTGPAIAGSGTLFTTELQVGSKITANTQTRTVVSITNAANLTVDTAFAPGLPANTIYYFTPVYPNFSSPPYCTPPACATNRGASQVSLGSGGFTVDSAGVISAGITNATNPIPAVCFDKGVSVGCNTLFPAVGGILIDSELISYTAVVANSFTVGTRGAGGMLAASHAINAGIHHATNVTGGAGGVGTLVLSGDATINVGSTVGFVIPGTIKIDQEYIYCVGTVGTTSFTGCTRGVQGSQAMQHNVPNNPASSPGSTVVQITATVNATVPTGVAGNAQRIVKGEQSVYLDGWVVGRTGVTASPSMIRWNGMNWDNVPVPANAQQRLNSVSMLDTDNDGDADDGFAVGRIGSPAPCNNALILRWNGTAWNCVVSPSNQHLNSIFMVSNNDGFAVGNTGGGGGGGGTCTNNRGRIIRWTGAWNCVASPVNRNLNSVFMLDTNSDGFADDGWIVGDRRGCINPGPTIIRLNAGAWACPGAGVLPATADQRLRSIFMISSMDGWAIGDARGDGRPTMVRWNTLCPGGGGAANRWNDCTGDASVTNQRLNSVFMLSATDGWAVGVSNGTQSTMFRWNIPCAGGAATGTWNDCTAPPFSTIDADLESVYMISPVDGWAVGTDNTTNNGIILHWDGASWVQYTSPTTDRFNKVFLIFPKTFLRIGDWQEVY